MTDIAPIKEIGFRRVVADQTSGHTEAQIKKAPNLPKKADTSKTVVRTEYGLRWLFDTQHTFSLSLLCVRERMTLVVVQ